MWLIWFCLPSFSSLFLSLSLSLPSPFSGAPFFSIPRCPWISWTKQTAFCKALFFYIDYSQLLTFQCLLVFQSLGICLPTPQRLLSLLSWVLRQRGPLSPSPQPRKGISSETLLCLLGQLVSKSLSLGQVGNCTFIPWPRLPISVIIMIIQNFQLLESTWKLNCVYRWN